MSRTFHNKRKRKKFLLMTKHGKAWLLRRINGSVKSDSQTGRKP